MDDPDSTVRIGAQCEHGLSEEQIRLTVRQTLKLLQLAEREVDILVVDEGYMAELNERWLGRTGSTDVIAVPALPVHTESLGDIALCWTEIVKGAAQRSAPESDEAAHLLIHAILHLTGFSHDSPDEYERMRMIALLIANECSLRTDHPFLTPVGEDVK